MATADAQTHTRPVAIAPAPAGTCSTDLSANGGSHQPAMSYTCQTCAKRKVKCDKAAPICSSCSKGKLECVYQVPTPRWRKRKPSTDVYERLDRYERILNQHGLLPKDPDTRPSMEETPQDPLSLHWNEPETSRVGKLLAGEGKSRYINSNIWRTLGDDEMQRMSDEEEDEEEEGEEDQVVTSLAAPFESDPLTGAFMGSQQSVLQYHPTHAEAMMLWKTHVENVEPLCKVLHIPSTFKMVEMISQQPAMASKADECLLFTIYHFSVFSMTEQECAQKYGQSRATLMQRYHFATRQALVNASFLKTTEMSILQALILFLMSCRHSYDPHTYWILTGVAMRIAQRMGIHRDGEKLGLPPFDVQMRRRLFYQLLPLDGNASLMAGTGGGILPDIWDTQQPLNVDDDQIWPGMTERPEERKGATEMTFCLARSCLGKFFARVGMPTHGAGLGGSGQPKDYSRADPVISAAESEVEEKYIRYCDIVDPLHFMTIGMARCGITAMRIRIRLPKIRDQTATDVERRELFHLAQKILDTDTAAYAHPGLNKYQWHVKPFFLWGTWDSLVLVLTSLGRTGLLSPGESDAAWGRLEKVYSNHDEFLESKRALPIAFGRLTLKTWDANPPSGSMPEPAFIKTLRSLRGVNLKSRPKREGSNAAALDAKEGTTGPSPASDVDGLFGPLSGDVGLDVGNDFNLDTADWMSWEQLIQDYRAQGGQQHG